MDKKTKKIICAIGIVTIMTGTFAAITPSVIKNDERYTDVMQIVILIIILMTIYHQLIN